jgi:hypothetical protein
MPDRVNRRSQQRFDRATHTRERLAGLSMALPPIIGTLLQRSKITLCGRQQILVMLLNHGAYTSRLNFYPNKMPQVGKTEIPL